MGQPDKNEMDWHFESIYEMQGGMGWLVFGGLEAGQTERGGQTWFATPTNNMFLVLPFLLVLLPLQATTLWLPNYISVGPWDWENLNTYMAQL